MFRNYLKIALRNIRKQKGYTFINIAGLAIGLTCCMLISLWILDELNYDKHYDELDSIQAILTNESEICPNALASFLQKHVPEIEYAARVTGETEVLVNNGSLRSYEKYLSVDPPITRIFSIPFISGNPKTALDAPYSVVITQDLASKFFPNQDALGKILSFNSTDDFAVTGVVPNPNHNSSLHYDMLVSIEYKWLKSPDDERYYNAWNAWSSRTYVKAIPGISPAILTEKISNIIEDRFEEDEEAILSSIHISDLYMKFSDAKTIIGIFAAIAVVILALACINFINLSTARYRMRSKETGVRKVIGASRGNLILQFLSESFFLTIVGFLCALGLVEFVLPFFNSLFQLQISLNLFGDGPTILTIIGIIIVTALAAGMYPALALSRFQPVQALKSDIGAANRFFSLRRILVITQFSLTVFLILGTAIIYTQINFIKGWNVGYDREHVINVTLRGESRDRFAALKSELVKNPDVISVAGVGKCLPYWEMLTSARWDGSNSEDGEKVYMNFTDYDFAQTYGIDIIEGRDFSEEFQSDLKQACVINKSLADLMKQTPTLGADIDIWGEKRKVIGVLEDFNFRPLDRSMKPLAIMMINEDDFAFTKPRVLSARISPNNIGTTLESIRQSWKKVLPEYPFEYSFLDQQFNAEYKSMEQIRNLAGSFGILAIFIACLGLIGLASFTAEQRTKEIGIRKVLGASVLNIVRLISKEFIILVAIANLIAWPLAWFAMNRWLEEYAHHMELSIGLFLVVGCLAMIVALLSVSYQAFRAARANPIEVMKYE
ncbi:MAG: FtsX-like permease family protein [candidate division Zixibacteria bacterium]|nr:FtsX-like permease family protein [candidate division Zixibacteria bacterium]